MKRSLVLFAAVVVLAAACSTGVKGAQRYTVDVDTTSPAGKNFQFSDFYPGAIKVRPGDSVVFENKSSQAPHTVSFGIDANRRNQPRPVIATGDNPAVHDPCYTTAAPTAALTKCPTKPGKTAPAYTGSGYWNSGFVEPPFAPVGTKKITLKLADSIRPGLYRYVCILHAAQSGVVEVVSKDSDRLSVDDVGERADREAAEAKRRADAIPDPKTGLEGTTYNAAAGWGNATTAVNRFAPADIKINAGTTVVWTTYSKFEPHTVSFGPDYKAGRVEQPFFAPSGAKSGSSYDGGNANSGIYGPPGTPFPPGPFRLTFSKAGTYKYVCILHPDMEGTVTVS